MTNNPNTSTPAVADLPQRLVDAAYDAQGKAVDARGEFPTHLYSDSRAATVAVLETLTHEYFGDVSEADWGAASAAMANGAFAALMELEGDGNENQ